MGIKNFRIHVGPGETEHITYTGKRIRRGTVLIRVGGLSLSKKAFYLGAALALCQIIDGLWTYIGLKMLGVHMEGNLFLRELIHAYGAKPVLFYAKTLSVILVVLLTFYAHRRRWIRPLIFILIVLYMGLAVIPWTMIILNAHSSNGPDLSQGLPQEIVGTPR